MLRFLLITVSGLSLAACGDSTPKEQASGDIRPTKQREAPKQILGSWKLVRQECEEGETFSDKRPVVFVRFNSDFSYDISVEGWNFPGRYEIVQMGNSPLRIRLTESMHNFDLVGERLENWSEGDATYLCGNIFDRGGVS